MKNKRFKEGSQKCHVKLDRSSKVTVITNETAACPKGRYYHILLLATAMIF